MLRVNVSTGELCLTVADFYFRGPLSVEFAHTYRSTLLNHSPMGFGWSHPYDIYLDRDGSTLILKRSGEEVHRFHNVNRAQASREEDGYILAPVEPSAWSITIQAESLRYYFSASRERMPVKAIEDRYNNRLVFEHDPSGRLTVLTDPLQRRLEFRYAGSYLNQIVMVSHAGKHIDQLLLECGYDASGNLIWTKDGNGAMHEYAYSAHHLVAVANPLGGIYCAEYDAQGRCIRKWERNGTYSRQLSYDARRRVTRVIDSIGYTTLYRFDEQGMLAELVDPLGGVTKFVRDQTGAIVATLDPSEETVVLYRADDEGRRLFRTDAGGATTVLELDAQGEIVAAVDACGHRWGYRGDGKGNITEYRSPQGYAWHVHYDSRGEIAKVIDPDGWETEYRRARDGLEQISSDRAGVTAIRKFDSFGRLIGYTEGDGAELSIHYHGLTEQVTNVDGSERVHEFNAMGQLVRFEDELGGQWRYAYDPYGRLLVCIDSLGYQLTFAYDAEGRLIEVLNENGDRFENTRDPLGRIIRQVGFDGCTRTYEYDAAGRLVGSTDGNGAHVNIECDAAGRPITRSYPEGNSWQDTYDPLGRLVRVEDRYGTLEIKYSPEGRLIRETAGETEVRYEYDWRPYPIRMITGSREVHFSYGERGRLEAVGEGQEFEANFSYDDAARIQSIRFNSGLCIRREYDQRNRLRRQVVLSSTGSQLLVDRYAYNLSGNLIERSREGEATLTFDYNVRGELTEVRRDGTLIRRYAYDPAGNRLSTHGFQSVYEPGDRLVSSPYGRYQYDAEGRRTLQQADGKVTEYRYDVLGRVSQMRFSDGQQLDFLYDALFRRQKKVRGERTEQTFWAGDVILQEERPDGTSIKYLFHPIDQTPLALAINDQWYYVLLDSRGEMTDLIRAADEAVVWSSLPLGFETDVRIKDVAVPIPLRGSGQLFDEETGLIYQRARYYDPREGRFVTPDPLGIFAGLNLYRFCLNQPFRFTDPLGLQGDPCNLTEAECDVIFNRMEQRKQRIETRWNEMHTPAQILPWAGAPPVGQPYPMPGANMPPAGWISGGTPSMGSVDSHLTAYEAEQRGMGNDLKEYYTGKCQRYEDKSRAAAMRENRRWHTRQPELPAYPRPLPPGIAGRAL
jgi:RHS repeat-associated protein